jgi:hypothetical protein
MASARLKCFSFINPSKSLGTSNQNPVTCLSYGGVSTSTTSSTLLPLKSDFEIDGLSANVHTPDFPETCRIKYQAASFLHYGVQHTKHYSRHIDPFA